MPRELVKDRVAEADLIGIWVYSFETWSEAQAETATFADDWVP